MHPIHSYLKQYRNFLRQVSFSIKSRCKFRFVSAAHIKVTSNFFARLCIQATLFTGSLMRQGAVWFNDPILSHFEEWSVFVRSEAFKNVSKQFSQLEPGISLIENSSFGKMFHDPLTGCLFHTFRIFVYKKRSNVKSDAYAWFERSENVMPVFVGCLVSIVESKRSWSSAVFLRLFIFQLKFLCIAVADDSRAVPGR